MGGDFGEKVEMGRDGPELDPPESTNPATGLIGSHSVLHCWRAHCARTTSSTRVCLLRSYSISPTKQFEQHSINWRRCTRLLRDIVRQLRGSMLTVGRSGVVSDFSSDDIAVRNLPHTNLPGSTHCERNIQLSNPRRIPTGRTR